MSSKQKVTIETTIDFELLRQQKRLLIDLALAQENELLDGLIALIDHIQDSFYAELLENQGREYADQYADLFIYDSSIDEES